MKKIVVTTSSFGVFDDTPIKMMEEMGYDVELNPYKRKLSPDELEEFAQGAVGVLAGTEIISKESLNKLKGLKAISRCGVGMDNVDISAAQRIGIKVVNTPDAATQAVVELTLGLILNILRKVSCMDRELRKGVWKKQMGNLLVGKKVGIIGLGRIGTKVADILSSLGCQIGNCDKFCESKNKDFEKFDLNDLLAWSEIVTIHISTSEELMGTGEFDLMKRGAWIINTSRGSVINEDALCARLTDGSLSGAAIDVFEKEPYKGCLKELDNVVITPHVGSYAVESRIDMEIQSVKNLLSCLNA